MAIQSKIDHKRIVKLHESGEKGQVMKTNGNVFKDQIYLVMEYVSEGVLYDVIDHYQGLGENAARFFMHQILDAVEYI